MWNFSVPTLKCCEIMSEIIVTKKPPFFPWLFVIGAFLLLIAAWTSMIYIASKFTPERIQTTVEPASSR